MQIRCGIYLWGANMDLVYPWYNLRQPKISLVYLEALVYTRDIPPCQNTKTCKYSTELSAIYHDQMDIIELSTTKKLLRTLFNETFWPELATGQSWES